MTQKLCRRLEELENISAAAAARRPRNSAGYRQVFDEHVAKAKAWLADPQNQKWLTEQPTDYVYRRVQSLRAYLQARASGHSGQLQIGGLE
jgi:predicted dehydrogenase